MKMKETVACVCHVALAKAMGQTARNKKRNENGNIAHMDEKK